MKNLASHLNNIVGQLASYGSACYLSLSDASDIGNWVLAVIPAVAGAILTYRISGLRKAEAAVKEQTARQMRIENDEREMELNLKMKKLNQDE